MKMQDAIAQLVLEFTPADTDHDKVIAAVVKAMPDKDVPDAAMRKLMGLGKVLRKLGA